MHPKPSTLPGWLLHWLRERPDQIAVDVLSPQKRSLTYHAFGLHVANMALWLKARGVTAGDRIPVFCNTDERLFIVMLALSSLRATALPISMQSPASRHVLEDCARAYDFKFVCGTRRYARFANDCSRGVGYVLIDDLSKTEYPSRDALADWEPLVNQVMPDDCSYVNYTSGSTSAPKIVEPTHAQVIANAENCLRFFETNAARRFLCAFTYHHFELITRALVEGTCAAILPISPVGNNLAVVCRDNRINHLLCNPNAASVIAGQPDHLLDELREQLEVIEVGGGPMPDAVAERLARASASAYAVYGSTETSGVCLAKRINDPSMVGYVPVFGYQAMLTDVAGNTGELVISGSAVVEKYLVKPPGQIALSSIGFHTKDLAEWNSDGSLRIFGRCDNVVKGLDGGRRSIEPIEQQLLGALGRDAFAVQLLDIDPVGLAKRLGLNSSLVAVVVFRPEAVQSDDENLRRVHTAIRRCALAPLVTAPQLVIIATPDEIEFTDTGKLRRQRARQLFSVTITEWSPEQKRRLKPVPISLSGVFRTITHLRREAGSVISLGTAVRLLSKCAWVCLTARSDQNAGWTTTRKIGIRVLGATLLLYALFLGLLAGFENRFVYHPGKAREGRSRPVVAGINVEDVQIPTSDGLRLHAVVCTQAESIASEKKRTVLYLHGNRGNVDRRVLLANEWLAALDARMVVFVDYRGYGLSDGVPSEEGLYEDGHATWRWLVEDRNVDPADIILVGRSIGGAVAVELAQANQIGALVLESTFCKLPEVAQDMLPFVPCDLLMRNRYPTIDRIRRYNGPLIIAHGRGDELITPEHAHRLFAAGNEPKRFIEVDTSKHMDWPTADYYRAVRGFLNSIKRNQ